jgi:hypothetical protein
MVLPPFSTHKKLSYHQHDCRSNEVVLKVLKVKLVVKGSAQDSNITKRSSDFMKYDGDTHDGWAEFLVRR